MLEILQAPVSHPQTFKNETSPRRREQGTVGTARADRAETATWNARFLSSPITIRVAFFLLLGFN